MPSFTFDHLGELQNSFAAIFMDGRSRKYRVSVDRGYCIMAPSKIPGSLGEMVWLQFVTPRSTSQNFSRLQSIGQGMQKAGMVPKQ
jgi:hypothetical protein